MKNVIYILSVFTITLLASCKEKKYKSITITKIVTDSSVEPTDSLETKNSKIVDTIKSKQ